MLNASCIGVCLNRLFSTLCGFASRLISTKMRMPSRSDSSRRSAMPSMRLSLTSSAIFSRSDALFTWYGQLGDDDRGPVAADLLERHLGAHHDAAAAVRVHLADGVDRLPLPGEQVALLLVAEDRAAGREVRPEDVLAEVVRGEVGVVDERDRRVADLPEVVGRDVRGHADGDARRPVDEQVRQLGRQHARLALRAVVVVDEVDGLLVDVVEHLGGDRRSGAPPCSAWPRRCRRRPSRSCPGRRRAGSAARSPGRAGRGRRTGRRRRAGGTCPSPRRRSRRTCDRSWWPTAPSRPSCRGSGDGPA